MSLPFFSADKIVGGANLIIGTLALYGPYILLFLQINQAFNNPDFNPSNHSAMNKEFSPKLFDLVKQGLTRDQVTKDILSGLVVGVVALPLAIAFAIASGVSPEKGLITAIVAGFIISAFGGSRVQIGGPTGAFIVIVYGIVQQYGVGGLIIATFISGFIIIGFGLARLGNYLKFIPYPLIVGFTSGIALIIFSSQINDFFGMGIANLPADFIDKWIVYSQSFTKANWNAVAIAIGTILITRYFYKIYSKIPGSIVAILLSIIVVQVFHLPVDTIESKFGEIPNSFSLPTIPVVDFDTIQNLIQSAFAIALLGAIESLLSAVVADGMIGDRHRPNIELVAQGGANIFSALFGGIPATGAIARTATNIKNGARTPIAGIVHALTLLLIMLLFAPYAKLIPLSCLAGILIVVAYNMSEWHQFVTIIKSRSGDILILLTTFFLTVIFDLVIAIEIGIVLSSFMFMKRMSKSFIVQSKPIESDAEEKLFQSELNYDAKQIMLYEINGPLFFGAAEQFMDVLSNIHVKPKILILRMRYVPFIDSTGFQRLKDILEAFGTSDTLVLISGVREELQRDFEKNNIYALVPQEHIFDHINKAITFAKENSKKSMKSN